MNLASRMMTLFHYMKGMGHKTYADRQTERGRRPAVPRKPAPRNVGVANHVRAMHKPWQDARIQRAGRMAVLGFFLAVTPFLTFVAGVNPAFAQAINSTAVDLTPTANNVLAIAVGALN